MKKPRKTFKERLKEKKEKKVLNKKKKKVKLRYYQ